MTSARNLPDWEGAFALGAALEQALGTRTLLGNDVQGGEPTPRPSSAIEALEQGIERNSSASASRSSVQPRSRPDQLLAL